MDIQVQQPVKLGSEQQQPSIQRVAVQVTTKNCTLNLEQNIILSFNQMGLSLSKQYPATTEQHSQQIRAINILLNYRQITSVGKDGLKVMLFVGDGDQDQEMPDQEAQQEQTYSVDEKTLMEIKKICSQVTIKNDISFNLNGNFTICIDLSKGINGQKLFEKEDVQQIYNRISENLGGDESEQSDENEFDMNQMISADDIDQDGRIVKKQEQHSQDQEQKQEGQMQLQ